MQNEEKIIFIEVLEGGKLPTKAHQSDAGFDLYASDDVEINSGEITKHPLAIRMVLPKGTYAEIAMKSGLGSQGMILTAKIVDEEYRGIPNVVGTKLTSGSIKLKKGDKIAQMIIHPFSPDYKIVQVDKVSTDTSRGEGGFGSSGR